jgi:DNA-binding winged helix-turn-helix (wHTH) protein/tetratricopeptide (TPR) repeat protein/TolB-like protein
MERIAPSVRIFRFGLFEADARRGTLNRGGLRVRLQEQPFRVLIWLLERPGEIITREELRQQLWAEGTFVDFDGSLNVILKKLRAALDDDSDNPRFIETVPRRGYRFIAPVTAENVAVEPPASVNGLVPGGRADLGIDKKDATQGRPSGPRRVHLYAVSAVVLFLLAGLGWYLRRDFSQMRTAPPRLGATVPLPRKSVAVLGFHNLSGKADDGWLATAFSEMLSTELAAGEKLRLVSGEDVANLRLSSPWSQTDTLRQETAARIGAALNGDVLVLGSYASIGRPERRQLRVDVRLQDARTGEILAEVAEIGSSANFFQLISRIGAKLRDRLGVAGIGETDQSGVLASLPSNPEAARFYTLGLATLRDYDCLKAKDFLQQAIKADPKFPLSHSMLARAWSQLGYEQKRKEEAKRALDLSANLPRVNRMLVEGDYYESLAQHEKAASTYQALVALFPDSVEYGLQLALAQNAAGQRNQAMETIAQLRRLPPPASADPRIDLAEERAMPNDNPAALVLVRNALAKAAAQDKKLVYAQARTWECMILIYGDHPEQGKVSCEDASKIFLAAGNRLGAADAMRLIGDSQGAQGHYEQAIATYQNVRVILQELGEHEKTGMVLNNMAIGFANEGKLDRAEQLYRKAKYHFEQAGDKGNTATALGNIADVLYLRGNLPDAAKLYQQTIESEALLDASAPGYAMYRLADLELAQGQPKKAHDLAAQAVDAMRPSHGGYQYLTGAMVVLGDALMAQGDLAGARQQYQQTLETRQKLGEQVLVAESQVSLAELSLEEGHPEQAEPLLRLAIAQFEREKEDPDATGAYTLLSRTLLTQGKLEEAHKAIQHAVELGRSSPDPALTLPIAIQTARIETAAAGQDAAGHLALATARQQLRSAIATTRKLGYYQIECEARLALAGDLRANPALGRSQLETLEKETHERGLELLSHKAELLASVNQSSPSHP